MTKIITLTGNRYGKLTVIDFAGVQGGHRSAWLCVCDCGKTTIVRGTSLCTGNTKSCGCLRKKNGTHNLYVAWLNMVARCTHPNHTNYRYYGGKGIKICSAWQTFEGFLSWSLGAGWDTKEKLQLHRFDSNGDYSPSNCIWLTTEEHLRLPKICKKTAITYRGKTMSRRQWSLALGGEVSLVRNRIAAGWSEDEAVSIPVIK